MADDYRGVWSGCEVEVFAYLDNGFGVKASETPVFEYCYFQDVFVRAKLNTSRRQVTGRSHGKIVNDDYEYEMSIGFFYLKKATEFNLTDIFNRTQPLILDMVLTHDYLPPDQKEHHAIRLAYATSLSIVSKNNGEVTGSAEFTAEEFD